MSSWLCALPIQEHGFALHKSAFKDALALWYGSSPIDLPTSCSCGKGLSVEHALSCLRGVVPTLRHNEIIDLTAVLLTETCSNMQVEPPLEDLDGEVHSGASAIGSDGARVDISEDDF